MIRRFCLCIPAFFVVANIAVASDPAKAIAAARAAIDAKEYQRAGTILQDSIADAQSITDAQQRDNALAAIHFYRGLALCLLGEDGGARAELREFFRFHPGYSVLDRSKYPSHF